MPATEQTWRDIKKVHLFFGISSVAMLAATVWMIADDHNREWKTYQEQYYGQLEVWTLQSRIYEQLAGDYVTGEEVREHVVREVSAQPPEPAFGKLFMLYVAQRAQPRDGEAVELVSFKANADARGKLPEAGAAEERFYQVNEAALAAAALYDQLAQLSVSLQIDRATLERVTDPQRKKVLQGQIQAAEKRLEIVNQQVTEQLASLRPQIDQTLTHYWKNVPGDTQQLLAAIDSSLNAAVESPSPERRAQFVRELEAVIKQALFREEVLQRDLKFRRADLDEARSAFNLAFGNDAPAAELRELQANVDAISAEVNDLNSRYESAKTYRERLERARNAVNAPVGYAEQNLERYRMDMNRLEEQLAKSRPNVGKKLLNMPILDAFSKEGDIKVRQIWLPDLTIDFNFQDVARFDRCMTCHVGIEKTAPGSAVAAGYPHEHVLDGVQLKTPAEPPTLDSGQEGDETADATIIIPSELSNEQQNRLLLQAYGFRLADRGVFNANDATIEFVMDRSFAADALLQRGDVLVAIGGKDVWSRQDAVDLLLGVVKWGEPLELKVRRGVPHPYSTHPRFELFGASTSPHPFATVGCTICHDGQGSATAFKWASHSPNSVEQLQQWTKKYGWFYNHHWIFPMMPKRFSESLCLKCHHDVVELLPSERFPEPPAPKLMQGYNLVREYGCFGCHEIKGYDSPTRSIGPDMRLEPGYTPAALALYADPELYRNETYRRDHPESYEQRLQQLFGPGVTVGQDGKPVYKPDAVPQGFSAEEANAGLAKFTQNLQDLAGRVVRDPSNDTARRRLVQLLKEDEARAKNAISPEPAYLSSQHHRLALVLADVEVPGKMRPVGPSLRYVSSKLSKEFVYNWIRNPREYQPKTRMPRFFGLYDHLLSEEKEEGEAYGETLQEPYHTEKLEQIEIRAITEYLLTSSQPFIHATKPAEVTEAPDAERGKNFFADRGCLACHQHSEFPDQELTADQGPNLSNIGNKLRAGGEEAAEKGARWLYSWLKNPAHYSHRTKMPNMLLEPVKEADGKVVDPAADIALFLMNSTNAWEPAPLPQIDQDALYNLALGHLQGVFTRQQAEQYLQTGIPLNLANEIKGDEAELLGTFKDETDRVNRLLRFVGARSVRKYGCFGCHDIPGMETAKPIGTGLADWGRKEPSKIAFNQIGQYIKHSDPDVVITGPDGQPQLDLEGLKDKDKAFFIHALLSHHREGFLWQKLRAPRSFDYEMTQNMRYDERLRMPQFPFTEEEREAVMTFILGLVAEPPADQFVYSPDPRQKAIHEGRKVLEQYNCGGCHTLEMPKFTFTFTPDSLLYSRQPPPAPDDYHELFQPHFTPEQIERSKQLDKRGLGTATITAKRSVDPAQKGVAWESEDDDGNIIHLYTLWEDALVNGNYWLAGDKTFPIYPESMVPGPGIPSQPELGGMFANWLYPRVVNQRNPKDLDSAWGYVPPPLVGEGNKVQPGWLYDFLREPYVIRPAVVLRMPKFNLSPQEVEALVNYFAAKDNATYPYEYYDRRNPLELSAKELAYADRLSDALKIVTNRNYCVACHSVGDFTPEGGVDALAPNLDQVHNRLRPDYLHKWIANPKHILPYTAMFAVIKPNEPIRPDKFQGEVGKLIQEGTSMEQVDAVVDLLLNYDQYMMRQVPIKPMIQGSPPANLAPEEDDE